MHIAGLVLARGGSKGIPLKNLQKVDGKPLLVCALDAMLQCRDNRCRCRSQPRPSAYHRHEFPYTDLILQMAYYSLLPKITGLGFNEPLRYSTGFQSVWVSSDHHQILDVGSKFGAQVHHRSAATSSDQSSSLDAILEFLESHPEVDVVGLVQCSSPFVQAADLEEACGKIRSGCDSVFSVRRSHSLRWIESPDGATLLAANFDPSRRPKRQDWHGDLVENGAFYFSRVHLLKQGLIQGGKMCYVEMSPMRSLDIDTPYDLWLANQQVVYCKQSELSNDHTIHTETTKAMTK